MSKLGKMSEEECERFLYALWDAMFPVLSDYSVSGSVAGEYDLYRAIEDEVARARGEG